MDKPVIIFGAKSIARSALEIFESNDIVVYGFLDEDEKLHGTEIDGISVLGDPEDGGYLKLIGQKCEAFVATDDNALRKDQVKMLMDKRKTMPTNAIHNTAFVAKSASIGHGNYLGAGVKVGAGTKIDQHCIVHAGAVLDQEVKMGEFVQIGAGAIIGNGVEIEKNAFIGTGVTVVPGIKIGKNARIGAGSVVIKSVEAGKTVFGNPAAAVGK